MPKDPDAENARFRHDMLKAFDDLSPEAFGEFRSIAAELGVPIEFLVYTACKKYVREERGRRQREM